MATDGLHVLQSRLKHEGKRYILTIIYLGKTMPQFLLLLWSGKAMNYLT